MKWFKHISDSLDDPFIFELMTEFGAEGYLVFFGILEIYSREFKPELNWKLIVTRSYLRQKLHKRQDTLVINSLKHIQKSGKWEIELNDDKVSIFIPKFRELMDEWSLRKLTSPSRVTPKILNTDTDTDKDKDKDKDKETNKGIKPSRVFQIPTLNEVSLYCIERKNQVHAQTFIDHYLSNGWMVGKNKMKDWKAAVRKWEQSNFGGNNGTGINNNRGFGRQEPTFSPEDEADINEINRKYYAQKAAAANKPKEDAGRNN